MKKGKKGKGLEVKDAIQLATTITNLVIAVLNLLIFLLRNK